MNIILGSTSPRRKGIISGLFESFEVMPPVVAENHSPAESPIEFSMRISEEKCFSVLKSCDQTRLPFMIITADTLVAIDDVIIGKPVDFDDAVRIITLLNGRKHRVITGLSLLAIQNSTVGRRPLTRYEITEVQFKKLTETSILRYLRSIDYRDKAGAYAFQENGRMIIEGYEGSVTNIIGFPLRLFFSMVSALGLAKEIFA
jgi:septum formation protein